MSDSRSVIIDFGPRSACRHRDVDAIVSVDVFRATTTAVTAAAAGRRCFPVSSIEMAREVATRLERPLLAGELSGDMLLGFDLNNSPAVIAARNDVARPLVLLSSSGTLLMTESMRCAFAYVSCLRNHDATVAHLAGRHARIAVLGAGSRDEFREEDQMCCAWIAEGLVRAGYALEDESSRAWVSRWSGAAAESCLQGNSAAFLRESGQQSDIDFVMRHVGDLDLAVRIENGELVLIPVVGQVE